MKDLLDYLGKVFIAIVVIWFVLKILVAVTPKPSYTRNSYSDRSYTQSRTYSGSSYKKKATPTPSSASRPYKETSKKSSYSSSSYRDPDDYMDVEGFYYDNRSDFESEDDAWDYLDDEWDEWD